jgi:hypothetical protein
MPLGDRLTRKQKTVAFSQNNSSREYLPGHLAQAACNPSILPAPRCPGKVIHPSVSAPVSTARSRIEQEFVSPPD